MLLIALSGEQAALADEPIAAAENKNNGVIFPQTQLYPHYLANPLRPTFSLQYLNFSKSEIANVSLHRYVIKMGGHLGIYRSQAEKTGRGWQATLSTGFQSQFDLDLGVDNIGWDGMFALSLEARNNKSFSHRFGIYHFSSHIGDELIERTGIKRITYTREEIRYGLTWFMYPNWQSYVEFGSAYNLTGNTLLKRWRTEAGMQYENVNYWGKKLGWYMGADFSSYKENNWSVNTSLHLGLISKVRNRNYRFGIELYDGRSPLGEFFLRQEKYINVGLWVDI